MKRVVKMVSTVLIVATMVGVMGNPLSKVENDVQAASYSSDRSYAVAQLKYMADIKWKPSGQLSIGGWSYKSSETYTGMPYTQAYNTTYSEFLKKGSYSSGVFVYRGNAEVGNDCSTVPALAWQFKCKDIDYKGIYTKHYMLCAKNGSNTSYYMKTVGGYKMGCESTSTFCTNMGLNKMKNYYQQLKPGDCCLHYYGDTKHVIFVVAVDSTGVTITDQCGRGNTSELNCSWRHNKKMTWQQLYESRYVPICCSKIS